MAPSAIDNQENVPIRAKNGQTRVGLESTGSLDKFDSDDLTPVIGREFANTNIVEDILNAPNADQLLRDLAITSMSHPDVLVQPPNTKTQSHAGVLYSSEPKTT